MGKVLSFIWLVVLLSIGPPGLDSAPKDDLVKLQKKEKKRRKKIKKSVLKITDKNIHELSSKSKSKVKRIYVSGSAGNEELLLDTDPEKKAQQFEDPADYRKTKPFWQNEKIKIENSITFYEKKAIGLQSRLNKLQTDLLGTNFQPAYRQIQSDMEKIRIELNESRNKVVFFKNQLEALHDAARRENIPPGWLR